MPWKEASVTDERVAFVRDYDRRVRNGEMSMSDLCQVHGIARKTGYKMINRRNEHGWPGLADRSRAPHSGPHWSDSDVVMRVLEVRLRFPHGVLRRSLPICGVLNPKRRGRLPAPHIDGSNRQD